MGRRSTRPSVYTVAERAGVSIATVSRVLHDKGPVAVSTRDKVLAAVAELRWRPSQMARALAGTGHDAVGIVFPDLAGPYYAEVIRGFEQSAVERRKAVLVLATHGRETAQELVFDLADRSDGVVVMGRTVSDAAVTELVAAGARVALLARPPVAGAPTVRVENPDAAEELTAHLLDHGRRRLAFLGDPSDSPDVAERWTGFIRAHVAAGVPVPARSVPAGGFDEDHGYKSALALVEEGAELDGIVAANDELAVGVCRALETSGLRVPQDMAVTGWDDTPMAKRFAPSLTTVRQPMKELGSHAAELLFARIEGIETQDILLPTSLVVRNSCGCKTEKGEFRR